jgi:hypothetical protein
MFRKLRFLSATAANMMLAAVGGALTALSRSTVLESSNTDIVVFGGAEALGIFAFVVGVTRQVLVELTMWQKCLTITHSSVAPTDDGNRNTSDGDNGGGNDNNDDDDDTNCPTYDANQSEQQNDNNTTALTNRTPQQFDETPLFHALRKISQKVRTSRDGTPLCDSTIFTPTLSSSTHVGNGQQGPEMDADAGDIEIEGQDGNNYGSIDDDHDHDYEEEDGGSQGDEGGGIGIPQ